MVSKHFLLLIFMLIFPVACTSHGPPEIQASIINGVVRPQTHTFVLTVHYQKSQPAQGIATFPNGGTAKILEEVAVFYLIDVDTNTITYLNQLPGPTHLGQGFTPWIIGWDKEAFYFKLTGLPNTTSSTQIEYYRMTLDGRYQKLDQEPQNLLPIPAQRLSPPTSNFLQINTTIQDIEIRTENDPTWQIRFSINSQTGEIELVP